MKKVVQSILIFCVLLVCAMPLALAQKKKKDSPPNSEKLAEAEFN